MGIPETTLKIRKKMIHKFTIYMFLRDFTDHRKKIGRTVVKLSNNLENKIPSDIYQKSSAKMNECSGSQFFRTTTGI